jgi:tetratricopeptide (TPR) repeat protein
MSSPVLLLTIGFVLTAIAPARTADTDATVLSGLEQRLTVDADNIQIANDYRRAIIRTGQYDRALRFFDELVRAHPNAANACLNFGFAYVDKIPAAGSITQVILANAALAQFTRAIRLQPNWIGYYTRGASYLFWPKIFGRAPLGIADLQQALRIQQREPRRPYHMRTFIALGDGYWKIGDVKRARAVWQQGLAEFPESAQLRARLNGDNRAIVRLVEDAFDPNRRVDTNLAELWSESS